MTIGSLSAPRERSRTAAAADTTRGAMVLLSLLALLAFAPCEALGETADKASADAQGSDTSGKSDTAHFAGKAGYYARQLHGHPTASGQSYDHGKMTCAHKTLPFGTKLKIVSRKNKRSCIVVVNDRGPHTPGMVIDVSGEAARQLGMVGDGLHHVDCYVVKPEVADSEAGDRNM